MLHEGVQGMSVAAGEVNDRLKQALTLIHETARRLSDVRPFLGQWRLLVLRHRQSGPLASHVGPIDAELEAAGDQLDELRSLAAQCQAAISSFRSVGPRPVADRDPHRGGVHLSARRTASRWVTRLAADWAPDQFFSRASAQLSEPVWADGVELHPSASLGVVLADPTRDAFDVDALIKEADAEMYRVKAARKRSGRA
jgi:hypothetical protein